MTHRELPASGRGCFAAVVIAPIAAFAGLMALTTLLNAHDDQATGPSFGLPHPTRVSESAPLDTAETEATGKVGEVGTSADASVSTIAERPLALRKPDHARPTTTVTVPSAVVATSSTNAAAPARPTPCTGRTKPAPTTTTSTTTTTATITTSAAANTTTPRSTVVASTTTTVTPKATTPAKKKKARSAGDTRVSK